MSGSTCRKGNFKLKTMGGGGGEQSSNLERPIMQRNNLLREIVEALWLEFSEEKIR